MSFYKFLASNLFKNVVEKLLYAFWRGESLAYAFTENPRAYEVFRAHAFWQGLGAMRKYFMPYGKKYSWHMPFGKGSGQ